jgi:hypothetical protein
MQTGFAGSKSISNISKDEHVVFFTSNTWFDEHSKTWQVPVHGWVYELEERRITRAMFAKLLDRKYGLKQDVATEANFAYRTKLLTADNEKGKRIVVSLFGERYVLPKSEPNGHFQAVLSLPEKLVDGATSSQIAYKLVLRPNDERNFEGKSLVVSDQGVSVISDVDDTVKLSYVTDHKRLFESSFFSDFAPVEGMPELYQKWHQQGAKFHYVSSSPWQLYEPLQEFMLDHGFPEATMSLKKIRFKDETFFNLFKSATKTKPQAINAIIKRYPNRQYILLGDSGEKDAQVYAQIANEHPEKIKKIVIRNVNGADNLEQMYDLVFDGLPRELWQVFEDPSEIQFDMDSI